MIISIWFTLPLLHSDKHRQVNTCDCGTQIYLGTWLPLHLSPPKHRRSYVFDFVHSIHNLIMSRPRIHRMYKPVLNIHVQQHPPCVQACKQFETHQCYTCDRESGMMQLMMSHGTSSMPMMQNPSKSFCRVVGHIENARDVFHENVSLLVPILDCKELHINVMRMCSGLMLVYHCNGCLVVFIESSGLSLCKAKVLQDRSQISCHLCCVDCSNELCLSWTCGNHSLQLGLHL